MSNRKMLNLLLTKKKLDCEMAVDGINALEMVAVKPNNYNLVFMDTMMPRMTGVECTRELRARGFDKLIIGLTGLFTVLEDA